MIMKEDIMLQTLTYLLTYIFLPPKWPIL